MGLKPTLGILVLAVCCSACTPLYVKNFRYESFVREADFGKAEAFLDESKLYNRSKNRLIYLLEKAKVAYMDGDAERSNTLFNEADLLIEDQQIDVAAEALSMITNDEQRPYKAEDFEAVAIHFYKALNYLQLGQSEAALVEARRINLVLQAISDKYPGHKNRYSSDALAHVLMGLIYESQADANNAFIAFRNAFELFDSNENSYMGVDLPDQLKLDLLRSARKSGFMQEYDFYLRKFGIQEPVEDAPGGHLVFFWESGLGPVKSEWSLTFSILPLGGDQYQFVNADLGLALPFTYESEKKKKAKEGEEEDDESVDIRDVQFVRAAFPKYVSRPDGLRGAHLRLDSASWSLSPIENYEYIASRALRDRFLREATRGLLRLALKKVTELQLRKKDDTAGALAGLVNTLTEKADTRNWQTLPASISYCRIPLQKGENSIVLQAEGPNGTLAPVEFQVNGTGRTVFLSYHSLPDLKSWSANEYYRALIDERPPSWQRR